MLLETFTLLKTANKLQAKIKERKQRENYDLHETEDDLLKKNLAIVIVFILIILGLYIWAIVDAAKTCGKFKMLHILLLILIPGYLPIYFLLRVTKTVCVSDKLFGK